jgi:hypothetical protein
MNSSSTKTSLIKRASPRLALHQLLLTEEPRCRRQVNARSWRDQDLSSERRNVRFGAEEAMVGTTWMGAERPLRQVAVYARFHPTRLFTRHVIAIVS